MFQACFQRIQRPRASSVSCDGFFDCLKMHPQSRPHARDVGAMASSFAARRAPPSTRCSRRWWSASSASRRARKTSKSRTTTACTTRGTTRFPTQIRGRCAMRWTPCASVSAYTRSSKSNARSRCWSGASRRRRGRTWTCPTSNRGSCCCSSGSAGTRFRRNTRTSTPRAPSAKRTARRTLRGAASVPGSGFATRARERGDRGDDDATESGDDATESEDDASVRSASALSDGPTTRKRSLGARRAVAAATARARARRARREGERTPARRGCDERDARIVDRWQFTHENAVIGVRVARAGGRAGRRRRRRRRARDARGARNGNRPRRSSPRRRPRPARRRRRDRRALGEPSVPRARRRARGRPRDERARGRRGARGASLRGGGARREGGGGVAATTRRRRRRWAPRCTRCASRPRTGARARRPCRTCRPTRSGRRSRAPGRRRRAWTPPGGWRARDARPRAGSGPTLRAAAAAAAASSRRSERARAALLRAAGRRSASTRGAPTLLEARGASTRASYRRARARCAPSPTRRWRRRRRGARRAASLGACRVRLPGRAAPRGGDAPDLGERRRAGLCGRGASFLRGGAAVPRRAAPLGGLGRVGGPRGRALRAPRVGRRRAARARGGALARRIPDPPRAAQARPSAPSSSGVSRRSSSRLVKRRGSSARARAVPRAKRRNSAKQGVTDAVSTALPPSREHLGAAFCLRVRAALEERFRRRPSALPLPGGNRPGRRRASTRRRVSSRRWRRWRAPCASTASASLAPRDTRDGVVRGNRNLSASREAAAATRLHAFSGADASSSSFSARRRWTRGCATIRTARAPARRRRSRRWWPPPRWRPHGIAPLPPLARAHGASARRRRPSSAHPRRTPRDDPGAPAALRRRSRASARAAGRRGGPAAADQLGARVRGGALDRAELESALARGDQADASGTLPDPETVSLEVLPFHEDASVKDEVKERRGKRRRAVVAGRARARARARGGALAAGAGRARTQRRGLRRGGRLSRAAPCARAATGVARDARVDGVRAARPGGGGGGGVVARLLAAETRHFVSALHEQVSSRVLETSWGELARALARAETLEAAREAHAAFLDAVRRRAWRRRDPTWTLRAAGPRGAGGGVRPRRRRPARDPRARGRRGVF